MDVIGQHLDMLDAHWLTLIVTGMRKIFGSVGRLETKPFLGMA